MKFSTMVKLDVMPISIIGMASLAGKLRLKSSIRVFAVVGMWAGASQVFFDLPTIQIHIDLSRSIERMRFHEVFRRCPIGS